MRTRSAGWHARTALRRAAFPFLVAPLTALVLLGGCGGEVRQSGVRDTGDTGDTGDTEDTGGTGHTGNGGASGSGGRAAGGRRGDGGSPPSSGGRAVASGGLPGAGGASTPFECRPDVAGDECQACAEAQCCAEYMACNDVVCAGDGTEARPGEVSCFMSCMLGRELIDRTENAVVDCAVQCPDGASLAQNTANLLVCIAYGNGQGGCALPCFGTDLGDPGDPPPPPSRFCEQLEAGARFESRDLLWCSSAWNQDWTPPTPEEDPSLYCHYRLDFQGITVTAVIEDYGFGGPFTCTGSIVDLGPAAGGAEWDPARGVLTFNGVEYLRAER